MIESLGIGRPSTYAPTISILETRKYITFVEKRIHPDESAFLVTKMLEEHFPEIVDSNFTANMEEKLDLVASGEQNWQTILKEFYGPFMEKIAAGKENIISLKTATPTGEKCPECESELLLRKGRFGEFIACSNFPKCKYTKNMGKAKEEGNTDGDNSSETTEEKCDKCGADMTIKGGKRGKFLACTAYPTCKNTKSLTPTAEIKAPCPECGGKLSERLGKRGKFYGCSNYPECNFIANFEPTEHKCSECGYMMGKKILKTKEYYECYKCKHKEDII
jgi:DNA topoisomerase-1